MSISLQGATQVRTMGLLMEKIDNQSGLVDQFILSVPQSYRPLPSSQVEAQKRLSEFHFGFEDLDLDSFGSKYY